ncbi:hypothetical protein GCM10027028_48810 [Streptomyces sundarbansensis]
MRPCARLHPKPVPYAPRKGIVRTRRPTWVPRSCLRRLRVCSLRPTAGFGVTVDGARGASGLDRKHRQARHSKTDIGGNRLELAATDGAFPQVGGDVREGTGRGA